MSFDLTALGALIPTEQASSWTVRFASSPHPTSDESEYDTIEAGSHLLQLKSPTQESN